MTLVNSTVFSDASFEPKPPIISPLTTFELLIETLFFNAREPCAPVGVPFIVLSSTVKVLLVTVLPYAVVTSENEESFDTSRV